MNHIVCELQKFKKKKKANKPYTWGKNTTNSKSEILLIPDWNKIVSAPLTEDRLRPGKSEKSDSIKQPEDPAECGG